MRNVTCTTVPFGLTGGGPLQGSAVGVPAAMGTLLDASVGKISGVDAIGANVGGGGSVGVGGMGVAVGIAAWVMASCVETIATAVFCISDTLNVGVGAGPQADSAAIINMAITDRNFRFMFISVGGYFYHK